MSNTEADGEPRPRRTQISAGKAFSFTTNKTNLPDELDWTRGGGKGELDRHVVYVCGQVDNHGLCTKNYVTLIEDNGRSMFRTNGHDGGTDFGLLFLSTLESTLVLDRERGEVMVTVTTYRTLFTCQM